ncbi:MAG: hypothetical protein IKL36_08775 [Clostridia bacterium]|nr:hypothetical protein [Clostridia bacterium]
MKKFITLMLAAAMMLTLASCASDKNDGAETTDPETTVEDTTVGEENEEIVEDEETEAKDEVPATGAAAVVGKIWGAYAEEEKFPCGGGDSENMNFEGPAAFDITKTEELDGTLGLPADLAGSLESAASFMHMMNANTFTGACYELVEGTDVAAFAETLKTNILARQWMCGIPETLVIINVDGEFVISAFGADDIIQTLKTNTTAQYASATVVVETAVTE